MNYGNNSSEDEGLATRGAWLRVQIDPAIYTQYPIKIYPTERAVARGRQHWHRHIEIIVAFRLAQGAVVVEGASGSTQSIQLEDFKCVFLPAGVSHRIVTENCHRLVSLFIDEQVFVQSLGESLTNVLKEDLRKFAWGDAFTAQLIDELDRRSEIYSDTVLTHSMLTALAVKIVERLLGRTDDQVAGGFSEKEQRRAENYIESNLEAKFCVTAFARHMALSVPNLNRRFRATFGIPPLQYVLKRRVDRALLLLRGGNARVADAAFAVGFCDQSHLDRHCRKFYGFPPGALIRASRL